MPNPVHGQRRLLGPAVVATGTEAGVDKCWALRQWERDQPLDGTSSTGSKEMGGVRVEQQWEGG